LTCASASGIAVPRSTAITETPGAGDTDHQQQLGRLLDLYLHGEFEREMLTDRRLRIEETINSLTLERERLAEQIEGTTLTDEQITTVEAFAAEVTQGIVKADSDFAVRRAVIEALGLRGVCLEEDGERRVRLFCQMAGVSGVIGSETLSQRATCQRPRCTANQDWINQDQPFT
jgi:hypothetical protein